MLARVVRPRMPAERTSSINICSATHTHTHDGAAASRRLRQYRRRPTDLAGGAERVSGRLGRVTVRNSAVLARAATRTVRGRTARPYDRPQCFATAAFGVIIAPSVILSSSSSSSSGGGGQATVASGPNSQSAPRDVVFRERRSLRLLLTDWTGLDGPGSPM